jgi:hypothetical protein
MATDKPIVTNIKARDGSVRYYLWVGTKWVQVKTTDANQMIESKSVKFVKNAMRAY